MTTIVDDDIVHLPPHCNDCGHSAHRPNECPRDNCGQGEISHGDALPSDKGLVVTEQLFQRGQVSTLTIKHIRPRTSGWS